MLRKPILLVDDDVEILRVYKKILEINDFKVYTAANSFEAIKQLQEQEFSVVISDIIMPKMDGMELLNEIKAGCRATEVIMLTAEGSISGAVDAVKHGAYSYLIKPVDIDEMINEVKKAEEVYYLKSENEALKRDLDTSRGKAFIGHSLKSRQLKEKAKLIGGSDSSVLITGESGTGKEVIANLIHNSSERANGNFVCVNCAAFNENLIESELFGSEKGAYTGSDRTRIGRFERANGGTLFFDEIGELSLNMQVKLLRVLQERNFERVGGDKLITSDFRLITATNKDLKEEVRLGNFREDLYYRINIIPLEITPLRERKEDITLLFYTFLRQFSEEMNKEIKHVNDDLIEALINYEWPGNVRELRNITERLVVLSLDGILNKADLPDEISCSPVQSTDMREFMAKIDAKDYSFEEFKNKFEREYICDILEQCDWNIVQTASEMGVSRKTLYEKMKKHGISRKNE